MMSASNMAEWLGQKIMCPSGERFSAPTTRIRPSWMNTQIMDTYLAMICIGRKRLGMNPLLTQRSAYSRKRRFRLPRKFAASNLLFVNSLFMGLLQRPCGAFECKTGSIAVAVRLGNHWTIDQLPLDTKLKSPRSNSLRECVYA